MDSGGLCRGDESRRLTANGPGAQAAQSLVEETTLPDARRPGGRAPPVALPLLAGVFALGCTGADETDGRHDVEVRDSAGVEVVRYLDPRVDAVPAELGLRIGVVDGREDEQFHAITGVATDAGGRIFVTDVGANAVRIFDRDGRFVRRIGGPGQGPASLS